MTPLRIVPGELGDVLHAIRADSPGFVQFGEAYFSCVHCGAVKAWKRHTRMTLNLVVPVGAIRFVLAPADALTTSRPEFFQVTLSRENYQRLTVPPGLWMGFQGIGRELNLLMNLADLPHDPAESERADAGDSRLPFDWERA